MGVYLSEPNTNKHLKEGKKDAMAFVSGEMQGWRKSMEDAAIHELDIGDGNCLFAVFDGHGGFEVSQFVREIFIETLKSTPEYSKKDYPGALSKTFKLIDEAIDSEKGRKKLSQIRKRKTNSTEGNNPNMIGNGTGCTGNVILITPEKYVIANIGDSRSALCRGGVNVPFSEDHKPENPEQERRIIKAGGQIQMGRVNGGLNLSRAFGDFDYKRNNQLKYDEQLIICKPDIKEIPRDVANDEFIIAGCDGIWQRYVENSQGLIDIIKSQLRIKKELSKIVSDILDLLLAKDTRDGIGCDNMTAILITLKPYP